MMLSNSYKVLDTLRLPNGLYVASPSVDYGYIWIRDCVYMSYPYLNRPNGIYEKTYHRMLDLFREYEWKLDILCRHKPKYEWEYLHARYSGKDAKEIHDQNWGHIQHDMIGAFLYGMGLGMDRGKRMIRDYKDKEILQKLVLYLENVEYWNDPDNGMWEEWREVHASSVGACVAGLKAVEHIVEVPQNLIDKGLASLFDLFPRESADKEADLAQLSLVYPYKVFSGLLGEIIVSRIEKLLLKQRGVIRYKGDSYYSTLEKEHGRSQPKGFYDGTEAEWSFGLPWLSLCHLQLGNVDKAEIYLRKTEDAMIAPGILPELYYNGTSIPNPNTPLGWSCAMYILAKEALEKQIAKDKPMNNAV